MTDQYILSFDPGLSTGICLGVIGDNLPFKAVHRWQFSGGAVALDEWLRSNWDYYRRDLHVTAISEKFTPLQNKGFSLTIGAVEPLRCEGILLAHKVLPDYPDPRWQRPVEMYRYGGKTLVEKKKLAKQFLKDHGMYITGKDVQAPNADDALSATWHGIAYAVKTLKHRATFQMLADWGSKEKPVVN